MNLSCKGHPDAAEIFMESTVQHVPVWDIATRLFHWLLALLVTVCLLTGEDDGLVFAVHAYAGYVVLVLLLFRAGWGVMGSRHSRFDDFVYAWDTTWRYALSLLRLRPPRYVGHNPLGGWMVVLMLLVLVATALSGIAMITQGARWLEGVHEALGSLMQVLVFVHIAGVLADRLLTGDRIVKAMITGRKELAEDIARQEVPVARAGRAVALAVLVLIGGAYLFRQLDYPASIAAYAAHEDGARKRGHDD